VSAAGIPFLGGFGALLGLILWRVTSLNTAPDGYELLDSFLGVGAAGQARDVLEGAGIKVKIEDHLSRRFYAGPKVAGGAVNLFVPIGEAGRAADVLRQHARAAHHSPPA